MKKIIMFAMLLVMALTFTACGNGVSQADYNPLQNEDINQFGNNNIDNESNSDFISNTPSIEVTSNKTTNDSNSEKWEYLSIHPWSDGDGTEHFNDILNEYGKQGWEFHSYVGLGTSGRNGFIVFKRKL